MIWLNIRIYLFFVFLIPVVRPNKKAKFEILRAFKRFKNIKVVQV